MICFERWVRHECLFVCFEVGRKFVGGAAHLIGFAIEWAAATNLELNEA